MIKTGGVETDRPKSFASPAEVEQSIPKRFAEIVARHANRTAVSAGSNEWSYAELDQRSKALAIQILDRLGEKSEPVALLMEHDAMLIAAILAVLKTEKIYLSLDPGDSIERLAAMLADSRARLLLADQKNADMASSLAAEQLPILVIARDFKEPSTDTNFPEASPKAGARLMYTSGSTGMPKGVWQNHCGIVHDADVYSEMIQLGPEDRLSLLTSSSFAAAGIPLFAALLNGATLCPFHVRSQGVERLAIWLRGRGITIYDSVPTIFRHLARVTGDNGIFGGLRLVRLGGEPVLRHDVEVFRHRFPEDCRLMNVLASTETGPISASIIERHTVLSEARVPVGRAVRDVEVFLVDDQGRQVENGCDGRIAVRSAYLRQGFWRRPDETREKFRVDPSAPDTRIFITNDLGRFLPDGTLEHLGRADRVIKIRGLRVDLEEVEATLRAADLFEEAAVTTFEHITDGPQVAICVVPRSKMGCSSHACRQVVQQLFPLPSRLMIVEELPRLASGKIDRVNLSKKASETFAETTRPRDDSIDAIEFQLVQIWEKVLAVGAIGTTDDFFALGGDSLAAATMFAAVEKFLGINLPTSTLLEAPTIKELSEIIRCGGLGETDLRLVTLRLGGTGPPLYYVPYASGNALEFHNVARYLTNDQPVFAFRPAGFNGRSPPPRSVEEMAKSYIETMRVHQPCSPYYICGASFGGVVAFEMARQLEAGGGEVAFLGLLDSYGGEYPKRRRCLTPRKRLKQALLRFLPRACYTFNLSSFKSGVKEQIKRWLVRRMILLDGWLRFRVLRCPSKLRVFYVQEISRAARRRYKLLPFTGKIDLFRAEHQPPSDLFEEDPLLGWGGMATGGIDVHQLPGHHSMYLTEPVTSAVAASRLEACLEKRRTEISARTHD
jgi:amino acid adenylation domain-containing protein